MLTVESTEKELYDFIIKNRKELQSNNPKAETAWFKMTSGAKGTKTSMMYEYQLDGITFWHFRYGTRSRYFYLHVAVLPFAKDKWQYVTWDNEMQNVFKYTHHFVERYKERLGLKGSMKQVFKHYLKNSNPMMCIYRKNNQIVFATNNGLVLGVEDERISMQVGCTFVDYSLLKSSHRAAFNKVQSVSEDIVRDHLKLNNIGASLSTSVAAIEAKYKDVSSAAEEVYSWYYQQGELRERYCNFIVIK